MEIPVTKPFLPPRKEYESYIEEIWKRNWLTNNGPLVQKLEEELEEYLDLVHLIYLANGTLGLQIAVKALGLEGELITTPFSYVATTSSLVWEGCKPVFVDIDPNTLNIDPSKIEEAVTRKTTGIVATHVFGNPCDIDAIRTIADRHDLKIIYDAAHCFGTAFRGNSIYSYGDLSIASFHATKLFHTTEGGAIITDDKKLADRIAYMRNFGHDGPYRYNGIGINGKNSEMHAAMGLCNLKYIDQILVNRKKQWLYYYNKLNDTDLRTVKIDEDTDYNYSYYPVVFKSERELIHVLDHLNRQNIYPRRYFYPLLSKLSYVESCELPISERIASQILCLPLYHDLQEFEQDRVVTNLLK